jgi:hypothetical protein
MPTYAKYKLAVYRYRGQNELGQEVLDHYILEADVGDIMIFKSDFLHNGVASESDGTLLFAYANNPSIKQFRAKAGGKVNLLDNRKLRNGLSRFKICVKGYLNSSTVRDAKHNQKLDKDEAERVSLDILMSKLQICKRDSEYIIFMQNVMFQTLALTVDVNMAVNIFIQLGVATGELDMVLPNEVIREVYDLRFEKRMRIFDERKKIKTIPNMKVFEWIELLLMIKGAPWGSSLNYNETEETEFRRTLRNTKFPVIDDNRSRNKILDVTMVNKEGLYKVMIINSFISIISSEFENFC